MTKAAQLDHQQSYHLPNDLRELLLTGAATTQEEICAALELKGHSVNQSKISRLLRKIGAVKSKNESGQVVYLLPFEPPPPTLASELSSLILDVVANETTIIVSTSPGAAQFIARVLDYHKNKIHILGTIAGDDTIFIAPQSIKKIHDITSAVKELLLV